MKILSFRPFRRVGEKLVVTNYMGWRKIYTANYEGATVRLLPFPEVKEGEVVHAMGKPDGLYGYWHPTKFEALFWPVHAKMKYVKFYGGNAENVMYEPGELEPRMRDEFGFSEELKDDEVYSMFDCSGCPCFSHKTGVYVSENYPEKIHLFEPLTADIVYKYFEKMRDTLDKIKWIKQSSPATVKGEALKSAEEIFMDDEYQLPDDLFLSESQWKEVKSWAIKMMEAYASQFQHAAPQPITEEKIDRMAENYKRKPHYSNGQALSVAPQIYLKRGFADGFRAALHYKGEFTKEDMAKCWDAAVDNYHEGTFGKIPNKYPAKKEYLNNLSHLKDK